MTETLFCFFCKKQTAAADVAVLWRDCRKDQEGCLCNACHTKLKNHCNKPNALKN